MSPCDGASGAAAAGHQVANPAVSLSATIELIVGQIIDNFEAAWGVLDEQDAFLDAPSQDEADAPAKANRRGRLYCELRHFRGRSCVMRI